MLTKAVPGRTAGMLTLLFVSLALMMPGAVKGQDAGATPVEIQVAPATLILNSSQGGWVTVHVDIPFADVVGKPLLNGVTAETVFADDCGDLVAKFKEADIKKLLTVGVATLKLTGMTADGAISGEDTVRVIARRGPRGLNRRG